MHIHVRVRTFNGNGQTTSNFTTQFFFDDDITDQVFAMAPYASRPNRSTRNANDNIYQSGSAGQRLLLRLDAANQRAIASYNIALENLP